MGSGGRELDMAMVHFSRFGQPTSGSRRVNAALASSLTRIRKSVPISGA
jgi:hypothetical protein